MGTAEIVVGVLTLLTTVVGFLIKWFWGNELKKEAEKKRRAEEDAATLKELEKIQAKEIKDSAAYRKQQEAIDKWRREHGL